MLNRLVRASAFAILALASVPQTASAAACVPGTLADYFALATGCSIGSALFSDFTAESIPFGADAIDPTDVGVVPFSAPGTVGLDFVLDVTSAGEDQGAVFLDTAFSYLVTGATIGGAGLTMDGATAFDLGTVTALEQLCHGGAFTASACAGSTESLITFLIGGVDSDFDEALTLTPAEATLGVLNDIGMDGGGALAGFVRNSFTLSDTTGTTTSGNVPEPAVTGLLLTGLYGLLRRRRARH